MEEKKTRLVLECNDKEFILEYQVKDGMLLFADGGGENGILADEGRESKK